MEKIFFKIENSITRLKKIRRSLISKRKESLSYAIKHLDMLLYCIQKCRDNPDQNGQFIQYLRSIQFHNLLSNFEEIAFISKKPLYTLNYLLMEILSRLNGKKNSYEVVLNTKENLNIIPITERILEVYFSYISHSEWDFSELQKTQLIMIKIPIHISYDIMFWPLFCHELMHQGFNAIFTKAREDLLEEFKEKDYSRPISSVLGRYLEELICDGISCKIFGEVYSIMLEDYIDVLNREDMENDVMRVYDPKEWKKQKRNLKKIKKNKKEPSKNNSNQYPIENNSSDTHPSNKTRSTFLDNLIQLDEKQNDINSKRLISKEIIESIKSDITNTKNKTCSEDELKLFTKKFSSTWDKIKSKIEKDFYIPCIKNRSQKIKEKCNKLMEYSIETIFSSIDPEKDIFELFDIYNIIFLSDNREEIRKRMEEKGNFQGNLEKIIKEFQIDNFRRKIIKNFTRKELSK